MATAVSFYILQLSNEKMENYEQIFCFIMLSPHTYFCVLCITRFTSSPQMGDHVCSLTPIFIPKIGAFSHVDIWRVQKFFILYAPCFSVSISDLKQFMALLFLPLHLS